MHTADASFAVHLLDAGLADQADVDRALNIFVQNTSPLLRTKTNQIRAKIASPTTAEGHFYFAALYRSGTVIGFAMLGYYPRCRLVVVDHMVIDQDQRGEAAFYVFSQLLQDVMQKIEIEVDFTVVELEQGTEFGGDQTGGNEMVRLLGQIGFGQVHTEYTLANMEPRNYDARYPGILMLKGSQKLYRIRREDLLDIIHCILFDHYLPWYRDFFGEQIVPYRHYLESLYQKFETQLHDKPLLEINGPERDALILRPVPTFRRSAEFATAWYFSLFGATAAVATAVIYVLRLPAYLMVPFLLTLLALFVGVAAASGGNALEVFERAIATVPGGRRKSRYPRSTRVEKGKRADQRTRSVTRNSPDESTDKQDLTRDEST
jgi:hypothetical protein